MHTIIVSNGHTGFTLLESMAVVAILTTLGAIAVPIYHKFVLEARLHQATTALAYDAHFLERYYAQNARFTLNSTTWPTLPILSTEHFNISFTGVARGAQPNTFKLQATAKNSAEEPRYLLIDQNHTLLLCHKDKSATLCEPRY